MIDLVPRHARLRRPLLATAVAFAAVVAGGVTWAALASNDTPSQNVKASTFGSSPVPETKPGPGQDLEGDLANPEAAVLQTPFSDIGPAVDVADVKTQLPQLLTSDRATFRVPLDEQSITDRLGAPLAATWASAARQAQYQEKYDALKDVIQDPTYRPYSDNRFVVETWSGVRVTGDTAFSLLDGQDEYLDGSGWQSDPKAQWQVQLQREAGTWKLLDIKSVQYQSP